MRINFNADPEFRRMVAEEVRAALIAMGREEVTAAVDEGIRRSVGGAREKVAPMIACEVQEQVRKALAGGWITNRALDVMRDLIHADFKDRIKVVVESNIDTAKIRDMLKARLDHLRFSIEL